MVDSRTSMAKSKNDVDGDENEFDEIKSKAVSYKCYEINTYSLPAKFAYFLEAARRISYSPNLVLYLTGIGLNKSESGKILGFRMIGMLLGGPFWGMIADRWHCHRLITIIMCIFSLLTMCIQPVITLQYGDPTVSKCPLHQQVLNDIKANCSNVDNCTNLFNHSNNSLVNTSIIRQDTRQLFYIMLFLYIAVAFSEGSAVGLVDTGTIQRIVLSRHRKIDLGAQKFLAALGGPFGIIIANILIDNFPAANVTCYSGIFIAYALFTILLAISVFCLFAGLSFRSDQNGGHSKLLKATYKQPSYHENEKEEAIFEFNDKNTVDENNKSLMKVLLNTLCKRDVIIFYVTILMSGVVYSPYTSFMFMYLKDLTAPTNLLSLSIVFAGTASIFGFFFSMKIITILGGTLNAIALTFFIYSVRYLGNSFLVNPWFVLFLQPLHAISYCLLLTSGVAFLKETSPPSILTTMVSIFNSIHFGVGTLLGSTVSGVIYEEYGGRTLFRTFSFIALLWFILLLCYICIFNKRTDKT